MNEVVTSKSIPTPLALAGRRILSASSAESRLGAAIDFWNVLLRLHGVAIVTLAEALLDSRQAWSHTRRLHRPSMGAWLAVSRDLLGLLAGCDQGCARALDDLAASIGVEDAERLGVAPGNLGGVGSRATETSGVAALLDEAVALRNRWAHGGALSSTGIAAMAGRLERTGGLVARRVDLLCGRRLAWIGDIGRLTDGGQLVHWLDLSGESPTPQTSEFLDSVVVFPGDAYLLEGDESGREALRAHSLRHLLRVEPEPLDFLVFDSLRGRRAHYSSATSEARVDVAVAPGDSLDRLILGGPRWLGSEEVRAPDIALPRKIASGDGTVVYRAYHSDLQRHVVLKAALDGSNEELEWEHGILRRIDHPNVVRVHEPTTLNGLPVQVFDYLEGESLQKKLAAGWVPERDAAVRLAGQVASAAQAVRLASSGSAMISSRDLWLLDEGQTAVLIGVSRAQGLPGDPLDKQWDTDALAGVFRRLLSTDFAEARRLAAEAITADDPGEVRPCWEVFEAREPDDGFVEHETPVFARKSSPGPAGREVDYTYLDASEAPEGESPIRNAIGCLLLLAILGAVPAFGYLAMSFSSGEPGLVSSVPGWVLNILCFVAGALLVMLVRRRPRALRPEPAQERPPPVSRSRPSSSLVPAPPSHPPPLPEPRHGDRAFGSSTVVVHYPAPISIAYRRFLQCSDVSARGAALFAVVERTLRYLVYLGVSDIFAAVAAGRLNADVMRHKAFLFLASETRMTMGMWVSAVREVARVLGSCPSRLVRPLPEVCRPGGPFDQEVLCWLVNRRNLAEHPAGALPLSEPEWRDLLAEARPMLVTMLQHVDFLQDYPLGFLRPALSEGSKARYRVYSCMGARVMSTEQAATVEIAEGLPTSMPFVAAPDSSELLVLWPMLVEQDSELAQRPSLFAFESILGGKGRFLTRIRSVAIDLREALELELCDSARSSHDWLVEKLRALPSRLTLPPGCELSEELQASRRAGLVDHVLGGNHLDAVIGVGGFATVYAATRADGQQVAVKVIETPITDRDLARFRREFDRLKSLAGEHPGFVRCFDSGLGLIEKRELPWYAMEYASGGDLAGVLEARRADCGEAAPWDDESMRAELAGDFERVADAVAHLHERGLVHRDLKPSNVLVTEDRELRLADFGLIKNLEPSDETLNLDLTSTGAPVGTRAYMSPEQALGREVGPESDVYALGVFLAEMAAGSRPEPDLRDAEGSTLRRDARVARLPRPLRRLILACTSVAPEGRPKDARMLHERFSQLVSA